MLMRVQKYVRNLGSLIIIVSSVGGVMVVSPMMESNADPGTRGGCATLESMGPSYESIKKQIKDLDRVDVSSSEYRQNTEAQMGLWRKLSALLMESASQIGDSPRLITAMQENGRAIQEYANAIEAILPYTTESPPSVDVRARFSSASARKTITARSMTDAARDICARHL